MVMPGTSLLMFLVIGGFAGWLAGSIMKGDGFGIVGNIVVGVIGAFIGGFVFSLAGISTHGLFGSFITAVSGAVILLYVVRILKKA